MPNITGLAEHFIYSNDDMYPTSPLTPDDFFAEDGRVRINMRSADFRQCKTQFRQVCLNSYRRVADGLGVTYNAYNYLRPMHGMAPMIKSHCLDCLNMLGEDILIYATAFRTEKQHNQYIYTDYECLKYTVAPLLYPFRYLSFQLGSEYIANTIRSRQYKVICINDTKIPNRKKFKWQNIKNAFEDIL